MKGQTGLNPKEQIGTGTGGFFPQVEPIETTISYTNIAGERRPMSSRVSVTPELVQGPITASTIA